MSENLPCKWIPMVTLNKRLKILQFVPLSAMPQIHQIRVTRLRSVRVTRLRSVRNVDLFITIIETTFGRDLHPHRRYWAIFLYCGVPKGEYYLNIMSEDSRKNTI